MTYRHIGYGVLEGPGAMLCNKVHAGPYLIVRLYSDLTHVQVRIFIEVFRFAIERVIYYNMKES